MKPYQKHLIAILILISITLGLRFYFQYGDIPKQNRPYFQDDHGYLYLQDYDPYVYYSNVQHGEAPDGFSFFLSYWHRFLKLMMPDITLMGSMGYSPLLFISLAVITIYFALFWLTKEVWPSLFGAFLFAINPFIFKGSYIGFADTNSSNLFFSILIVFLYFIVIDRKSWFYSILLFLSIWLFSWFWSGWWYIVIISLTASFLFLLINKLAIPLIKKEFKINTHWKYIFIFLILCSLFFIFSAKYMVGYKHYFIEKDKINTNYNQIAELKGYVFWPFLATSLPYFLFFTILFSIIYYFRHYKDKKILLLLVFFLSTVIISTQGIRFIFFALIPYYFFIGLIAHDFNEYIFNLGKKYIYFLMIISFIFIILLNSYKGNYDIVGHPKFTIVNDDIYYSLKNIDTEKEFIVFWDKFSIVKAITEKTPAGITTSLNYGLKEIVIGFTTDNLTYSDVLFRKISRDKDYIVLIFPNEPDIFNSWQKTGILRQFTDLNYTEDSFLEKHKKNTRRVVIYEQTD